MMLSYIMPNRLPFLGGENFEVTLLQQFAPTTPPLSQLKAIVVIWFHGQKKHRCVTNLGPREGVFCCFHSSLCSSWEPVYIHSTKLDPDFSLACQHLQQHNTYRGDVLSVHLGSPIDFVPSSLSLSGCCPSHWTRVRERERTYTVTYAHS